MMKVYEFIKQNRNVLVTLRRAGLSAADARHLPMYEEYVARRCRGEKAVYVVACLSEKYGVCKTVVWDVVRRFDRTL